MRLLTLTIIILSGFILAFASPRTQVKNGNKSAKKGDADQALTHYVRALQQNGDTSVVLYDMGNALYDKGDYNSAAQSYQGSLGPKERAGEQAATLYNLGNSFYQGKEYDKAIASYIESLKRNPGDAEAKYNLELARRMLQQQQQQEQQNQDQKDQQKQNKQDQQKQDQKQDQQSQDKQDQKQQQQHQEQQEKQQQQAGQQMSQQDAERLLNALLQDEQQALHDAKKVKVMARAKRVKDW